MSDPVPAAAAAVGYDTETLSGPITAGGTWLQDTIHGDGSPNVTYNSDGSVTIAGGGDPWNGQLTTALPTWPGYTGEVFGGGFYAQATVTVAGATSGLSPWTGGNDGDQWPSFWANSSNNATDYNTIETDFMELEDGTPGQYQATIINWTTDPQQGIGQTITAPAGDTLNTATYGFRWIPATATTDGSMTFYLDGQQVGTPITWTQADPGLWGAIDGQQMTLFIGAGDNSPATFSNVEVWQASTADDSINGSPAPYIAPANPNQTTPTPGAKPSPSGTTITAVGQTPIIDAKGNSWSLVQSATRGVQIAVNGVADTPTGNVVLLESLNGAMVQENSSGNWYSETANNDSWVQLPGNPNQTTPPPGAKPSPSGTTITAVGQTPIIDAKGNSWSLVQSATRGVQIAVNGVADTPTGNVVLLESLNGAMVQENSSGNWYSETTNNDSWVQLPGNPNQTTAPTPTASLSGTTITAVGQSPIIDAKGNSWSLVQSATRGVQIAVNGVADTPTGNVVLLESLNGAMVQENSSGNWYSETTNNDSWVQLPGNPNQTTTPTPTASPSGTTSTAVGQTPIIDAANNSWSLVQSATRGVQIAVNGVADTPTGNVVLLETLNGAMVQENSSGNWYSETKPNDSWVQLTPGVTDVTSAGTLTQASSTTGTFKENGDTIILSKGNIANVTLGSGNDTLTFIGSSAVTLAGGTGASQVFLASGNNTITAGTGSLTVAAGGGADAYVFHSGDGHLTIKDFSTAKGDTLTVDKALQGSMVSASDGAGGTMLTFGSGHTVDLQGVTAVPTIHYT